MAEGDLERGVPIIAHPISEGLRALEIAELLLQK
jgi:hypothetical protein